MKKAEAIKPESSDGIPATEDEEQEQEISFLAFLQQRALWHETEVRAGEAQQALKHRRNEIAQRARVLRFQQQQKYQTDSTLAAILQELDALEVEHQALEEEFQTLQQQRNTSAKRLAFSQDRYYTLVRRAHAAIEAWKRADALVVNSPSAHERYRARIQQSIARETLEHLIGAQETAAILDADEHREWMRK